MNIEGTRFGTIEYTTEDVVHFDEGLIGFSKWQDFILLSVKPGSPFRWLQSLTEPALAFLTAIPTAYIESYMPEIDETHAKKLGLTETTPTIVLTTATIPAGSPHEMTLNLTAPIIINAATRHAKQLVLEDPAYTIKHRVFQTANRSGEKQAA
jgi:flagellar assembly factor FliW